MDEIDTNPDRQALDADPANDADPNEYGSTTMHKDCKFWRTLGSNQELLQLSMPYLALVTYH
jgi:hypothetical protein